MIVIKPGPEEQTPRGVVGGSVISQATAGALNMFMGRFRVPPSTESRPHYHDNCESTLYMLSGTLTIRWGERLERELTLHAGDMLYVPPRETHIVRNPSESEPADYVVARNSPQEDAVVVPWAQGSG